MFLTRLAVHRPVTTLMACLIVAILGTDALTKLSIDLMPDVTLPVVSITTVYEGASPQEVETVLTRPLEQALGAVQGVERLTSTSLEGSSVIRAQFAWGTNLDSAMADMRARIERIREFLPDQIESPYIERYDVADFPFIYLALESELEPVKLTQYAEQTIIPRLERVDGVAAVRLRGGVRREIQVALDRGKLETLNLGVNEVVTVLQQENVNQPAGYFRSGHLNLLIRSQGQFEDLNQIAGTVIRQENGALVRLRDVADIVDGHEEITELTRINGKAGTMIYINKQSGANMVGVSDRVRETIDELNGQLTRGQLSVRIDNADFIRQVMSNLKTSSFYGMGLAVLVLIVFLQSFRSTLVISITMPLSILATFILIFFQGFTLNIVSFGGLALGIGMLVDNSIVVLESIFRKRDEGLAPKEAAIEGTREVSSAIIASTLTTLIVFLPLLFIVGMTGIMLNQLAWVVSFSLLCSLFASLTLTPMLSAYWLGETEQETLTSSKSWGWVRRMHRLTYAVFSGFERAYVRVLRGCLRWPGFVGFLLLAGFCAAMGLYPLVGTELMPKTDEGSLRIDTQMAAGIQLHELSQKAAVVEQALKDNVPEASTWVSFIGDGKSEADDWNEARFRIRLKPKSERQREAAEISKQLAKKIGALAGMKVRVQASNEMRVFRMMSYRTGTQSDIEVEVRGHDLETGEQLARAVSEVMKEVPGLSNVEVQLEQRRPELVTTVDRSKASMLGVNVASITQALETNVRGTEATVFREAGDEFNIRVWLREDDRNRMSDVEYVGVPTGIGQVVALKNLVKFKQADTPVSIDRRDQQRFIGVSADIVDRDLGSTVRDLQQRLKSLPMPEGFSLNVAGDWEQQQDSFEALKMGFLMAIILMYMVMASQFESLLHPLLILFSVPLGAIGVMLMLVLSGTTLNVQSFIGVVMLAGIVVNNAIVLIDYANQLREHEPDADLKEIILKAASRRFRPILMTTLTTVLAMLPLALGLGEGSELQAPMARVVIGGLTSGTLITLVAIPLLYHACESRRRKPTAARS